MSNSLFNRSLCRLDGLDFTPSGGGGLGLEEEKSIYENKLVLDCLLLPVTPLWTAIMLASLVASSFLHIFWNGDLNGKCPQGRIQEEILQKIHKG